MTESSSSITTLAHIGIGQDKSFTVYLIQPPPRHRLGRGALARAPN
jgi:hypothetical protein